MSGDILFYKETDLPPGVHTLELVAYREHTHTASVRIATVETGKPAPGIPQVSSLMILQSAERAGTRPENTAAVHFGDWLLVPNLGEPVDGDTELAFAFAIEGSVATSHPKAAARILSGGRSIAGAPLELPPPGADGRIAYVGRIPLPSLQPGTYQLAVAISEASKTVQRLAAFRIANR